MKKFILIVITIDILLLFVLSMLNIDINTSYDAVNSKDYYAYSMLDKNDYYKDFEIDFVKNTDNYVASNKQDLLNIFYSILNNGYDSYNFKCNLNYENCTNDIISILNDDILMSAINNYVSPFNSYSNISLSYVKANEYKLILNKLYSEDEIEKINNKILNISKSILDDDMSDSEKIRAIHDFIVINAVYDNDFDEVSKASNLLFTGKALCSGYADLMALFLDNLNIPNFKVITDTHVWNAVYVDGNWLHLDVTWDDPITSNGIGSIRYDYYLVSTNKLYSLDKTEHSFDKNIYMELA